MINDSFRHSAVYPRWRRWLTRIPLIGRLFRRTAKFKSLKMDVIDAQWPRIDPNWFDTEYQKHRMPVEMIKPENDHEC